MFRSGFFQRDAQFSKFSREQLHPLPPSKSLPHRAAARQTFMTDEARRRELLGVVVRGGGDNVLSFFPVNSEIIFLYFFFLLCACATNKSTVTFLRHFFRYARASVRTGSYAPGVFRCVVNSNSAEVIPQK